MNVVLPSLNDRFKKLHERSQTLVQLLPEDVIYQLPSATKGHAPFYSCGEYLLRSAAAVEQTFGGITVNLWDDPFEWTLPEALPTAADIIEYLNEAEATRHRGFALLQTDDDLNRKIVNPAGEQQTLADLILATLMRAAFYHGCASAIFRLFSAARLPHI